MAALKKTNHQNISEYMGIGSFWEFATTDDKSSANKCNFLVIAVKVSAKIPATGTATEKTLESERYLYIDELKYWSSKFLKWS